MKCIIIGCLQLFLINAIFAKVKPNSLFSDHMILQKGAVVNIWGTADEGELVTVSFNGQVVKTATQDGKWAVKLAPLPYISVPQVMTIVGKGKDTIYIRDILVGEVWLCSGQSNMERQLGPRPPQPLINDWEQERDSADYPAIREYYVPLKYASDKVLDANNKWTICSPNTVADFSAVGYFFAKNLHRRLKVPVGIIFSAFGGTPAEDWTSEEALKSNKELTDLVNNYEEISAKGYKPPGKLMNGLYNGMIYPLIPYTIKGVAWYQGEANNARPEQYQVILPNMIRNWRNDFKQGDFPFLIVQIAPYKDMTPEIRESQLIVTEKVKNTALIVTTDCGDANDIHPPFKQPVGERLALAAEALAYHQKIEYSGPVYQSYKVKGNKMILSFTHGGFKTVEKLKGFTIAGADKKFMPAQAEIKGNTIIVSNPSITKPVAVRYGWANVPDVNLYNTSGLPASPFRTDRK